jgi:hypothetical protein
MSPKIIPKAISKPAVVTLLCEELIQNKNDEDTKLEHSCVNSCMQNNYKANLYKIFIRVLRYTRGPCSLHL